MARPYFAELNNHVTYWAAARKPRSATITALTGAGQTTLAAPVSAGATSIQTVVTAAIGQRVIVVDGTKTEERIVSNVTGAGPFTLTVPGMKFDHSSGVTVSLQPTGVNLRIQRSATLTNIPRLSAKGQIGVWTPG